MADVAPTTKPAASRHKLMAVAETPAKLATKVAASATRKAPTAGKTEATKKTVAAQKPVKANASAKSFASSRKSITSKAKTVATTVPKGKAAATEHVCGRLAKAKSR